MPREVMIRSRQEHYAAPCMVLAAAGRVDHDRIVTLAEAAFARLPGRPGKPRKKAGYQGGDWRDERELEQVNFVLGFAGVGYRDPDFYALSVLSTLLGGGMSSRLFQEVREKRGLVYSIYTFPASYSDIGIFGIYAGTGEDEVGELVPLVCEEMIKVAKQVGDDELARARAQLKSSVLMSLESTSSRCEQLARQLMVFGRPIPVAEAVAKIEAVDADAVLRVARRLLASRPTVAGLGPIGKLEPYDRIVERLQLS
jgi:predicted Zn-dependent peptidase